MKKRNRLAGVLAVLLCAALLLVNFSSLALAEDSGASPVENAAVGAAEAEPEKESGSAESTKQEQKEEAAESSKPEQKEESAESRKSDAAESDGGSSDADKGGNAADSGSSGSEADSDDNGNEADSGSSKSEADSKSESAADSAQESVPDAASQAEENWNAAPITGSSEKSGVTVRVSAPEGSFLEGTTLSIEPLDSDRARAVRDAAASGEEVVAFDITFKDLNGNKVQPKEGKPVSLTFSVDGASAMTTSEDEEAKLQLFHIHDNGSAELLKTADAPAAGNGTEISVSADSFSVYLLSKTEAVSLVGAEDVSEKTDIKVTEFSVRTTSDETAESLMLSTYYKLHLAWDASAYGNKLKEGDYFTVELPDAMRFPSGSSATRFDLLAPDGSVVAKAVVDPLDTGGGKVTATFTDYVENRYRINGTMSLTFTLVSEKVTVGTENSFTVTVEGETKTITIPVESNVPGEISTEEILNKWASTSMSTDDYVAWVARINFGKKTLSNVVITDSLSMADGSALPEGICYLPERFVLTKRTFDAYGNFSSAEARWSGEEMVSSGMITFNEDYTAFTLNLGDIDSSYLLNYYSSFAPKLRLKNEMTLTSTQRSSTITREYGDPTSGGTGEGDLNGRIVILKVDAENEETRLPGAVFRITSADGESFELTTDENGEAVSDKLVAGTYTVVEVEAPAGYLPDSASYEVDVESGSPRYLTVTNSPEKISIPVNKVWIGPAADAVTVKLLADDAEFAEATLTAAGGWKHTFVNLPKYSSTDGHAIVYRLEEVSLAGYRSDVNETEEGGFTVTNINTATVDIPVTKTWIGPAADEVTVKLLADGEAIAEAVLNADRDWKYTFTNLPKYNAADGHEIVYTVEENALGNYEAGISGSAAEGFAITNINIETISIPVTKTWIGPGADEVTVKLLADGAEYAEAVLSEANGWKHTFANLPKYSRTDGHEIAYTVRENEIEHYDASVSGSAAEGFAITNTNTRTGQIPVQKVWVGDAGSSVTIHLLADGEVYRTATITKAMNWKFTFTELPLYDSTDGHAIRYSLREDAVDGYTSKIQRSSQGGFVVTNTKTPTKTPTPTSRSRSGSGSGSSSRSSRSNTPKTGDTSNILGYVLLLVAAGGVLAWLLIRKRRNSGTGE